MLVAVAVIAEALHNKCETEEKGGYFTLLWTTREMQCNAKPQ